MTPKGNEWIFTFGCGQKHAGKCVRIKGTYADAREKMFRLFGKEWSFQYSATQWEEFKESNLPYEVETEVPIEDLL